MSNQTQKSNLISSLVGDQFSDNNKEFLDALEVFIKTYKKQKQIHSIPLNLFSERKLGVLEVIVKYLKENNDLSYCEIAKLLNRDDNKEA